jgi:hypothetical protein
MAAVALPSNAPWNAPFPFSGPEHLGARVRRKQPKHVRMAAVLITPAPDPGASRRSFPGAVAWIARRPVADRRSVRLVAGWSPESSAIPTVHPAPTVSMGSPASPPEKSRRPASAHLPQAEHRLRRRQQSPGQPNPTGTRSFARHHRTSPPDARPARAEGPSAAAASTHLRGTRQTETGIEHGCRAQWRSSRP